MNDNAKHGAAALLHDRLRHVQRNYEEKIAELSMIREMETLLVHVNSFDKTCRALMDIIIRNTVAHNCSIMLLDENQDRLFLAAASNSKEDTFIADVKDVLFNTGLRYFFKNGEGGAGKAVASGKPVLIENTAAASAFGQAHPTTVEIGSLLCIPLQVRDRPIGVLNLSHKKRAAFKSQDINPFLIVSGFAAISIFSSLNYERLQYSESRYRALAESTLDGIAVIRSDGLHRYANPAYQFLCGSDLNQLRRQRLDEVLHGAGEGGFGTEAGNWQQRIIDQSPLECQMHDKQGCWHEVELTAAPIDYSAEPAMILSVRDITVRKKLEARVARAHKMEIMGTVAATVAHDLNNMLSGIVSYPDLILMDIPDGSPIKQSILTIKKSGQKAAAIVQDLLALARRGVAHKEIVNPNLLIREYLESPEFIDLRRQHPGVDFRIDLAENIGSVNAASVHLSKTLMNLVSNAAEALDKQGEVTIATAGSRLDQEKHGYETIAAGNYAQIRVRDNGVGIPAEDVKQIFEPFFTKKRMGRSGTGLGMSVVWATVKDLGGYIDVESREGRGTTITLYLPLSRETAPAKVRGVNIDDYRGSERVLVVDDLEDQRQIASALLGKLGYRVTAVASGEEALRFLQENTADIIVLDMIMEPGMDGCETYQRIIEQHPRQRAVIASGFAESDRVRDIQRLGAGAYINKPYTLEKIASAIRRELDRKIA